MSMSVPAFVVYTEGFLARRKKAVGTDQELSQRALEIILGRMVAEGKIPATNSNGHARPQVNGDDVTDEVLAEAVRRHREYLRSLPVSISEARKAVAEFDRFLNGKGDNWDGIVALNGWMDLSAAKAQMASLEGRMTEAELDFNGDADHRELRDAALNALRKTREYVFEQHVLSLRRQITVLSEERPSKAEEAETELKKRLATVCDREREKQVRELASRLHRAGFGDPKRKPKRLKKVAGYF